MKRKRTLKSSFIVATILSLFAFAFVNSRANAFSNGPLTKVEMAQNQVKSEESEDSKEIPIPDVTVLGRLWEIAQRLLEKTN